MQGETHCPPSSPIQRLQRQQRLDNGRRVVGRIDLLIRTADGLVVMDHKLAGNSDGKVAEIVAAWASQLGLYATAIARVSGKPPVGTWLNLPLEGRAVRVSDAV